MNKQAIGYHNAADGGYSIKGAEPAAVETMEYVQSIALEPQGNDTPQYANGRLIGGVKVDNGYSGSVGTTARDPKFEEAQGFTCQTAEGNTATISNVGNKRTNYHYSFKETQDDGTEQVIKVWLLNCSFGKAAINNSTDKESVEFGAYSYPVTVYGEPVMDSEGKNEYVDDNGNKVQAYMILAKPGDSNYKDFFATVPTPKMPAPAAPTKLSVK